MLVIMDMKTFCVSISCHWFLQGSMANCIVLITASTLAKIFQQYSYCNILNWATTTNDTFNKTVSQNL